MCLFSDIPYPFRSHSGRPFAQLRALVVSAILGVVLWAHDEVNPTRIELGAVPGNGVQAHRRMRSLKLLTWPPTLAKPGLRIIERHRIFLFIPLGTRSRPSLPSLFPTDSPVKIRDWSSTLAPVLLFKSGLMGESK